MNGRWPLFIGLCLAGLNGCATFKGETSADPAQARDDAAIRAFVGYHRTAEALTFDIAVTAVRDNTTNIVAVVETSTRRHATLILFRSPPRYSGHALMARHAQFWYWARDRHQLPRGVSPLEISTKFDIGPLIFMLGMDWHEDYTLTRLPEEIVNGKPHAILWLVARTGALYFENVKFWIDPDESVLPTLAEFTSLEDKAVYEVDYEFLPVTDKAKPMISRITAQRNGGDTLYLYDFKKADRTPSSVNWDDFFIQSH